MLRFHVPHIEPDVRIFPLLESLAQRVVPAHPKKLQVIAESACESDELDAQVLAEFLALDMMPQAWVRTPHRCPTPPPSPPPTTQFRRQNSEQFQKPAKVGLGFMRESRTVLRMDRELSALMVRSTDGFCVVFEGRSGGPC